VLVLLVGAIRILLRLRLEEGEYKMMSWGAVKWAFANALVLVVSITFMDFILLTPLAPFFFRLMGARVGENVQINSKNCADLSLLEIGDGAVIGGHATVIAHSFERGRLILRRVRIGANVVVGLNSVVLPGSDLGRRSMLAAGTVLSKDACVGEREVYFGVPAQSTRERREREELLKKRSNGKEA
jgi:acetyltransferase-like isoleucine patch superfamily enzyme